MYTSIHLPKKIYKISTNPSKTLLATLEVGIFTLLTNWYRVSPIDISESSYRNLIRIPIIRFRFFFLKFFFRNFF